VEIGRNGPGILQVNGDLQVFAIVIFVHYNHKTNMEYYHNSTYISWFKGKINWSCVWVIMSSLVYISIIVGSMKVPRTMPLGIKKCGHQSFNTIWTKPFRALFVTLITYTVQIRTQREHSKGLLLSYYIGSSSTDYLLNFVTLINWQKIFFS
jgi:hypothetical protein